MNTFEAELFAAGVRTAVERYGEADLDAALGAVGWVDALRVEPRVAVDALFEPQGAVLATSRALDELLDFALGLQATAGPRCVVLPALGSTMPPGTIEGSRVRVVGLTTAVGTGAESVVVVAKSGDRHMAQVVAVAGLSCQPVHGMDPDYGLRTMRGETLIAAQSEIDWRCAVALAQRALSRELIGAAREMLRLARDYAVVRHQFGQPIGSFQAIRHRLAEVLVAIEAADAIVGDAWTQESPELSAVAKAVSGRAATYAARHCQQVLGGIGFTAEHRFHRLLRRVLLVDQLFGSTRVLTRELGTSIVRSRRLPPLSPL